MVGSDGGGVCVGWWRVVKPKNTQVYQLLLETAKTIKHKLCYFRILSAAMVKKNSLSITLSSSTKAPGISTNIIMFYTQNRKQLGFFFSIVSEIWQILKNDAKRTSTWRVMYAKRCSIDTKLEKVEHLIFADSKSTSYQIEIICLCSELI